MRVTRSRDSPASETATNSKATPTPTTSKSGSRTRTSPRVTKSAAVLGSSGTRSKKTIKIHAAAITAPSTDTRANNRTTKTRSAVASIRARAIRASRRRELKEKDSDDDDESDTESPIPTARPGIVRTESPKIIPKANTPLPRRKLKLSDEPAPVIVTSKTEVLIVKTKKEITKVIVPKRKKEGDKVPTVVETASIELTKDNGNEGEGQNKHGDDEVVTENNPEDKDKDCTSPVPGPSASTKEIPKQEVATKAAPPAPDPRVLKLIKHHDANCDLAEESALEYISTSIHHPVISCLRELNKADINFILGHTAQCHKNLNHIEMSMLCLGMLDYIAVGIDNPLYSSGGKVDGKNVEKIVKSLKKVFLIWSRTKDKRKNRSEPILAYLKNLIPRFELAQYGVSFSELINGLELAAKPLNGSKSFNLQQKRPTGTASSAVVITTSSIDRTALLELSANPYPTNTAKAKERGDEDNDNEITILESAELSRATKRTLPSSQDQNVNLITGSPQPKKSKCENDEKVKILSPSPTKPVIKNAFAIMMGKSRELAKDKQQQGKNNVKKTKSLPPKPKSTGKIG